MLNYLTTDRPALLARAENALAGYGRALLAADASGATPCTADALDLATGLNVLSSAVAGQKDERTAAIIAYLLDRHKLNEAALTPFAPLPLSQQVPTSGGGLQAIYFSDILGPVGGNGALVAALFTKVDKESGKGLSSNDYLSADKAKLAALPPGFAAGSGVSFGSNAAGELVIISSGSPYTKITQAAAAALLPADRQAILYHVLRGAAGDVLIQGVPSRAGATAGDPTIPGGFSPVGVWYDAATLAYVLVKYNVVSDVVTPFGLGFTTETAGGNLITQPSAATGNTIGEGADPTAAFTSNSINVTGNNNKIGLNAAAYSPVSRCSISGADARNNSISGADTEGNSISGADAHNNSISGNSSFFNEIAGSSSAYNTLIDCQRVRLLSCSGVNVTNGNSVTFIGCTAAVNSLPGYTSGPAMFINDVLYTGGVGFTTETAGGGLITQPSTATGNAIINEPVNSRNVINTTGSNNVIESSTTCDIIGPGSNNSITNADQCFMLGCGGVTLSGASKLTFIACTALVNSLPGYTGGRATFINNVLYQSAGSDPLKANLDSPTFTGTVRVPNAAAADNAMAYGQRLLIGTTAGTAGDGAVVAAKQDKALTGYALPTGTPPAIAPATDTVLTGLGKLENRTNANAATASTNATRIGTATLATAATDLSAALNEIRNTLPGTAERTTTTVTLVLADAGYLVPINNTAAVTLIVPLNSAAAFPLGTVINLMPVNTGQIILSPVPTASTAAAVAGVVTIRQADAQGKSAKAWGEMSLRKRGTDEWVLTGYTAA